MNLHCNIAERKVKVLSQQKSDILNEALTLSYMALHR